jgi:hypothetical protein
MSDSARSAAIWLNTRNEFEKEWLVGWDFRNGHWFWTPKEFLPETAHLVPETLLPTERLSMSGIARLAAKLRLWARKQEMSRVEFSRNDPPEMQAQKLRMARMPPDYRRKNKTKGDQE